MSQSTSFTCNDCGGRIEDGTHPVVVYIVAGLAPMHPVASGVKEADITDYPLPQTVRDLLAKPIARDEMCVACAAEKLKEPLVDKDGNVLAAPENAREFMKGWTPAVPVSEEVSDGA